MCLLGFATQQPEESTVPLPIPSHDVAPRAVLPEREIMLECQMGRWSFISLTFFGHVRLPYAISEAHEGTFGGRYRSKGRLLMKVKH